MHLPMGRMLQHNGDGAATSSSLAVNCYAVQSVFVQAGQCWRMRVTLLLQTNALVGAAASVLLPVINVKLKTRPTGSASWLCC